MNRIIKFSLVKEAAEKDKTGQTIKTQTTRDVLGKQLSVFQAEFFQAEQVGLKAEGKIEMSSFDYEGEQLLKIDNNYFVIYRTFNMGTDKIELYYAAKVGTNGKE